VLAQRQQQQQQKQQQQQQQQYFDNGQGLLRKSQPVDNQRAPPSQDRYTTPVPIIRLIRQGTISRWQLQDKVRAVPSNQVIG
jgi:hypothetical protein